MKSKQYKEHFRSQGLVGWGWGVKRSHLKEQSPHSHPSSAIEKQDTVRKQVGGGDMRRAPYPKPHRIKNPHFASRIPF